MPSLASMLPQLPWPDALAPDYRIFSLGRWRLQRTPALTSIYGYWTPMESVPPGYMLQRKTKGRWVTWMSLTPMELQSHQPHIHAARGNVVVGGLGMGMYLFNILRKPEVERVLVFEKDKKVIDLFDRIADWKSWPGAEKLQIRHGDIMHVKDKGQTKIDFLYMDIWEKLGEEIAALQTQTVYDNLKPVRIGYWGQEFDYATFLMQNEIKYAQAENSHWELFGEMLGLPLIGAEITGYPKLACAAVALQASAGEGKKGERYNADQLLVVSLGLLRGYKKESEAAAAQPASPATQTLSPDLAQPRPLEAASEA